MPLSTPVDDREFLNLRTIEMRGYRRPDGLYDIEGRMTDRRQYDHVPGEIGTLLPAGEALHDMWVRLTLDERLTVQAVEAVTDSSPYAICREATASMQGIVGLRIARGWAQTVKDALPPTDACTHLREILTPMATAAFQTISPDRRRRGTVDRMSQGDRLVGTCIAYRPEGEIVAIRFPEHKK
jgi:hypothetical protein